ncbi:MAG: ribbon-helix-helix protein, CopG family [Myxococcota bacterium]
MRTTVRLDDDLLAELKEQAHREGISLTQLMNRVLRAGLKATKPRRRRIRIQTVDMGPPKIDLGKALHVAADLEDEEILRKLALRK